MTLDQILMIIYILAYSIGIGIIVKNQKGKIDTLKTQVNSYNGIMSKMEGLISAMDKVIRAPISERYENLIRVIEKTSKKEMEQVLKDIDEYQKKMEAMSRNGALMYREAKAMFTMIMDVVHSIPYNQSVEKAVGDMPDSSIKIELQGILEKKKQAPLQQQLLNYLLTHPEVLSAFKSPEPRKPPEKSEE